MTTVSIVVFTKQNKGITISTLLPTKFNTIVTSCCFVIFSLIVIIIYTLQPTDRAALQPRVVCTTSIIADALKNIAGSTIEIISLMGPGVDPHLYKPIESDVLNIDSADIIFYNGLHLEAKLADIFTYVSKHKTTIAVTHDITKNKLLPVNSFAEIYDPHVWFDINLWIVAISTMSKALIKKYPHHKKLYKHNTKNYIKQLRKLIAQTHSIIQKIPVDTRVLITGHDAFAYFGRLYDCKVIGLQGISTESSPGAYDLQKIVQLICDNNIPAIFIETSIPIKNILAIQEGVRAQGKHVNIGGELYSDALGQKNSPGQTYIDMIMHNTTTIAQALQQ